MPIAPKCSGGFRLGPGGHRPPNLAQAPEIFGWIHSALFLLEGFWGPEICLECVGGRGFARTPLGELTTLAPPDLLVGWGGGGGRHPCQEPHASRRLDPRAISVQRSLLGATFLAYTHLNFGNTPLIASIVISLRPSRGCLRNDEGPGPPNIFS